MSNVQIQGPGTAVSRMRKKDPVTRQVYDFVMRRDEYRCVAPRLDGRASYCHDWTGNIILHWPNRPSSTLVTLHHVHDTSGSMGKRAPSDPDHLVVLCWGHHLGYGEQGTGGSIWGTKKENLARIRRYLEDVGVPVKKR